MIVTGREERGFVLVAVIVLLAILTIFGAGAMLKSNIEIKVSLSAVESEQAMAAANAGLNETYAYWLLDPAGQAEFTLVGQDVVDGSSNSAIYFFQNSAGKTDFPTPATMDDLGANMAAVDALITNTPGIRVYEITAAGMNIIANNAWGTGQNSQVAVWATSFFSQTEPAYPYAAPGIGACSDCTIVAYAIGASGHARRLLREHMGVVQSGFGSGLGSITNAFQ